MTKTEQFEAKVAAIPDAELAEKCDRELSDLCKTRGDSFLMSIPPGVNDTDILFSELIKRFKSRDKWVSVDQPPKQDGYYLVYILRPIKQTTAIYYCKRYGWGNGVYDVSHWQPYPEPPKEDRKWTA